MVNPSAEITAGIVAEENSAAFGRAGGADAVSVKSALH